MGRRARRSRSSSAKAASAALSSAVPKRDEAEGRRRLLVPEAVEWRRLGGGDKQGPGAAEADGALEASVEAAGVVRRRQMRTRAGGRRSMTGMGRSGL